MLTEQITMRKVKSLVVLLQRTPMTDGEAIFAEDFLSVLAAIAQEQERANAPKGVEVVPDPTPGTKALARPLPNSSHEAGAAAR